MTGKRHVRRTSAEDERDRLLPPRWQLYTCLPPQHLHHLQNVLLDPFFSEWVVHSRSINQPVANILVLRKSGSKWRMQPFRLAAAVAGRRACTSYMGAAATGRRLYFSASAGRTADPEVHARDSDVEPAVYSGEPEVYRLPFTFPLSGQ